MIWWHIMISFWEFHAILNLFGALWNLRRSCQVRSHEKIDQQFMETELDPSKGSRVDNLSRFIWFPPVSFTSRRKQLLDGRNEKIIPRITRSLGARPILLGTRVVEWKSVSPRAEPEWKHNKKMQTTYEKEDERRGNDFSVDAGIEFILDYSM